MREQQAYVSCAVATANGFAMPYRATSGSHPQESAIYRQKPARKRSRWRLPNAISKRPGTAAPSVTRN
jgi:hypothetical protein